TPRPNRPSASAETIALLTVRCSRLLGTSGLRRLQSSALFHGQGHAVTQVNRPGLFGGDCEPQTHHLDSQRSNVSRMRMQLGVRLTQAADVTAPELSAMRGEAAAGANPATAIELGSRSGRAKHRGMHGSPLPLGSRFGRTLERREVKFT